MKKLIIFAIIAYLCYSLFDVYQDHQQSLLDADYMLIEQVKDECEYLITSGYLSRIAPDTNIITVDIQQMHESQAAVWVKIQEDLGEEFETNLSNSDNIYISLNEKEREFAIFAGNNTQKYMLYPNWKYPDIPAPEGYTTE